LFGLIPYYFFSGRGSLRKSKFRKKETQLKILSELFKSEKPQRDLSIKLSKSKLAISENLNHLVSTKLIKKIEKEGTDQTFYKITPEGKEYLKKMGGI
ncbi:unnamed protein product, partial [marine sediment metagenome]